MKLKTVAALAAITCLVALAGCNRTERATVCGGAMSGAYVPGENFGDGGATRCGTVNIPPALKPCG